MLVCVSMCVCEYVCVCECGFTGGLSGIHSDLPIERLIVQSQPVVIWCSVFL